MIRTEISVADRTNEPVVPTEHHIVIGDFSLNESFAAQHATSLVHHLRQSGRKISTFSKFGPTYAQHQLEFHTKRRFHKTQKTLTKLARTPYVATIYLSELGFSNITKPNWGGRRKEEWRRCITVVRLGLNAQKVLIVSSSQKERIVAAMLFIFAPFRTNVYRIEIPARHLFRKMTDQIARPANNKIAAESLAFHTGRNANIPPALAIRTAADRLQKTNPERSALVKDLHDVFELATRLKHADGIPLVEKIRVGPQRWYPDTKSISIANEILSGVNVSKYMQHMNASLAKPFDLSSAIATRQFTHWYVNARENQKTLHFHPIPSKYLPNTSSSRDLYQNIELLFRFAHRVENLNFVHNETLSYLEQPLGQEVGNLTRLELLFALTARLPPTSKSTFLEPWKAEDIKKWFQSDVTSIAPVLQRFSTIRAVESSDNLPKIEVKGVEGNTSGLAENTCMSKRSLQLLQKSRVAKSAFIHHVNADKIPQQVLNTNKGFHIGYLLWELERVPTSHRLAGNLLDEIWVPSEFLREIYAREFGREIINIGKGLTLPSARSFDFSRYEIPGKCFVFAICFDAHSSVERKNPLAAVKAFQLAFSGENNVRLIVKTTPVSKSHWGDPNGQMRQIRKFAARDKRIVVIDQIFSTTDLMSLIANVDCIISSHRAEGFGYIPAYALGYCTPVIATDYSGTTDFCTSQTAFPVPFKHIEVKPNESILPVQNTHWAEIDLEKLAQTMVTVLSDYASAVKRAQVGQALIRGHYNPVSHAERYHDRFLKNGIVERLT